MSQRIACRRQVPYLIQRASKSARTQFTKRSLLAFVTQQFATVGRVLRNSAEFFPLPFLSSRAGDKKAGKVFATCAR